MTLQSSLFQSVIPSAILWSPPLSGSATPEGRMKGVPGQLYTQTTSGQLWCKGTIAAKTGWFMIASNLGHPAVLIGSVGQTNPNGIVQHAGPAVWYGLNKSIWVKGDSANDTANWKLILQYYAW